MLRDVTPVHPRLILCLCSEKEKLKDVLQGDKSFHGGLLEDGSQEHIFLMVNSASSRVSLSLGREGVQEGSLALPFLFLS